MSKFFLPLLLYGITISFLASCSGNSTSPTETSTPSGSISSALVRITKTPSEFDIVSDEACSVAEWETIRISSPQGDLIAWAPGQLELAYLLPKPGYSWFTGDLAIASGKGFQDQKTLTSQVDISGGLSWSPDGKRIAFLALRPSEQVYTVMAMWYDGSGMVDLFPGDSARTDEWSSPKGILGWASPDLLKAVISCGAGCDQAVEIDVASGKRVSTGEPGHGDIKKDNWQPSRYTIEFDASRFPAMIYPSWSLDGKNIAYFDEEGNLWVLRRGEKSRFPIDTGHLQASEAKWSYDSHYLAVRTDGRIMILEIPCSNASN